jgi:hypothetical protein
MDRMSPVIICEERNDFSINAVVQSISERGIEPHVIETPKLSSYAMSCELSSLGVPEDISIGQSLISDEHRRIWWRRPTWPEVSNFGGDESSVAHFRTRQYALALKSFASCVMRIDITG